MPLTKLGQSQIDLGSETAIDLLAMQNSWKKDMIDGINTKVPGNAGASDTMPVLVEKFLSIVRGEDSDSDSDFGQGYFSVFGRYLSCPGSTRFYLTGLPLKGSWSISVRQHCDFREYAPNEGIFGFALSDPSGESFVFENHSLLTWNNDREFFLYVPHFSDGSWDEGRQGPVSFGDQLDDSFPSGKAMYDVSLSYDADARAYSVSASLAGDPSVSLSVEFADKDPLPFGEDGKNTYLECLCPPFCIFDFSGFRFFNDGLEVFSPSVFPEGVGPSDGQQNPYLSGPNLVNFSPDYGSSVLLVSDICNNKV